MGLCLVFIVPSWSPGASAGLQWFPLVSRGLCQCPDVSPGLQGSLFGLHCSFVVSRDLPWFPGVSAGLQWFPLVSRGLCQCIYRCLAWSPGVSLMVSLGLQGCLLAFLGLHASLGVSLMSYLVSRVSASLPWSPWVSTWSPLFLLGLQRSLLVCRGLCWS